MKNWVERISCGELESRFNKKVSNADYVKLNDLCLKVLFKSKIRFGSLFCSLFKVCRLPFFVLGIVGYLQLKKRKIKTLDLIKNFGFGKTQTKKMIKLLLRYGFLDAKHYKENNHELFIDFEKLKERNIEFEKEKKIPNFFNVNRMYKWKLIYLFGIFGGLCGVKLQYAVQTQKQNKFGYKNKLANDIICKFDLFSKCCSAIDWRINYKNINKLLFALHRQSEKKKLIQNSMKTKTLVYISNKLLVGSSSKKKEFMNLFESSTLLVRIKRVDNQINKYTTHRFLLV